MHNLSKPIGSWYTRFVDSSPSNAGNRVSFLCRFSKNLIPPAMLFIYKSQIKLVISTLVKTVSWQKRGRKHVWKRGGSIKKSGGGFLKTFIIVIVHCNVLRLVSAGKLLIRYIAAAIFASLFVPQWKQAEPKRGSLNDDRFISLLYVPTYQIGPTVILFIVLFVFCLFIFLNGISLHKAVNPLKYKGNWVWKN